VALVIFPIELVMMYVLLIFALRPIENRVKEDPFGNSEHRMTKMAGVLRFSVFLLIAMAWVSGRYVTEKDLADHKKFSEENLAGISFPVLSTIQRDIFNGSFSGRFSKKYLSRALLTPIPRFDYPDKPAPAPKVAKKEPVLRDLNEEFERKPNGKENPKPAAKPPKEHETAALKPSAEAPKTIYRDLTLKGISGTGDRRLALINDQTLGVGETVSIKIENRKIVIHCVQILENSALVRVEDKADPIKLQLGIATNLKGEPVTQN
jgi:hypothetical protein